MKRYSVISRSGLIKNFKRLNQAKTFARSGKWKNPNLYKFNKNGIVEYT